MIKSKKSIALTNILLRKDVMLNKIKIFITLTTLAFVNLNCTSDEFDDRTNSSETTNVESNFVVNNNRTELSEKITYINRTATIKPVISSTNSDRNSVILNGAQEQFYWEYVAEVAPLEINGEILSATHISIENQTAFVTYHKQGDMHLGAVEIINLSNPNFPQITSQATFQNADINAVNSESIDSNNSVVWLALSDRDKGSQLYELQEINGQFSSSFRRVNISNQFNSTGVSASANGIAKTSNYLYITSGKSYGGVVQLNKNDFTLVDFESFSNAKYVAVNNLNNESSLVSLETGDNAKIRVSNISNELESTTFDIGEILHQNVQETYRGKSTMEFSPLNSNQIYIAKGKDGVALVDITTGTTLYNTKGTMLVTGNSNGVSVDFDYVYKANGSDGISISPHPSENDENILPIFYWDLNAEDASANYIKSNGEWVFVAKGGGGFKILRKREKDEYKTITTYNNNGKPDGLEPDLEVCSTLLPNIYNGILPERQNAMVAHPEYFENPLKQITIQEETELYLTFLDEGAGYKNVLGYYTYNENELPETSDLVDKIVIFPNASAEGSGGELERGNTMRLLGTFQPGTVVSFFLIANGWRNGSITDGFYSQHTDIDYNLSGKQQSLIFYDSTCNSVVIAFEDISVPNGDNDFNDAIFEITSSNPEALNTSSMIQI